MYSITMMVVLNSRIVFKNQEELIRRPASNALEFHAPPGDISVMHGQGSVLDPGERN